VNILKKIGTVLAICVLIVLLLSPLGILYYAARTERITLFLIFSIISIFYAYFFFKFLVSLFQEESNEDETYKISLTFRVLISLGIISFGWIMLLGRALSSVDLENLGKDIFYWLLLVYFIYHVGVLTYNEYHKEKIDTNNSVKEHD